jgi:hypothetical protein
MKRVVSRERAVAVCNAETMTSRKDVTARSLLGQRALRLQGRISASGRRSMLRESESAEEGGSGSHPLRGRPKQQRRVSKHRENGPRAPGAPEFVSPDQRAVMLRVGRVLDGRYW